MSLFLRSSLRKVFPVLLFLAFLLSMPMAAYGEQEGTNQIPKQIIIALDESGSMDENDSENKRYDALAIFSALGKVLNDSNVENIQLGVFPFAERVFGPANGKIALGSPAYINPKSIASRIRGGSRGWTRIDRVLQDASRAFWINSRKIIILLSDGVDSVYIEPEYMKKVFGGIKKEFRNNRNLVRGTHMYNIVNRCNQRNIKIHSLVINSAFWESYVEQERQKKAILGEKLLEVISKETGGISELFKHDTDLNQLFYEFIEIAKLEGVPVKHAVSLPQRPHAFYVDLGDSGVFLTTENNLRYVILANGTRIDLNTIDNNTREVNGIEISYSQLTGTGQCAVVFHRPPLNSGHELLRRWQGEWQLLDENNRRMSINSANVVIIFDLKLEEKIKRGTFEETEPLKLYFSIREIKKKGKESVWHDIIKNASAKVAVRKSKDTPLFNAEDWKLVKIEDGIIKGKIDPVYDLGEYHLHCMVFLTYNYPLVLTRSSRPIKIIPDKFKPKGKTQDYRGNTYAIPTKEVLPIRPHGEVVGWVEMPHGSKDEKLSVEGGAEIIADNIAAQSLGKVDLDKESFRVKAKSEKGSGEVFVDYKLTNDKGDEIEHKQPLFYMEIEGESVLKYPFLIKVDDVLLYSRKRLNTGKGYVFSATATHNGSDADFVPRRLIIEKRGKRKELQFVKEKPGYWKIDHSFNEAAVFDFSYTFIDKEGRLHTIDLARRVQVEESEIKTQLIVSTKEFYIGRPPILKGEINVTGGTKEKRDILLKEMEDEFRQSNIYLVSTDNFMDKIKATSIEIIRRESRIEFQIGFPSVPAIERTYELEITGPDTLPLEFMPAKKILIAVKKLRWLLPFRFGAGIFNFLLILFAGIACWQIYKINGLVKIDRWDNDEHWWANDWFFLLPKQFKPLTCRISNDNDGNLNIQGVGENDIAAKKEAAYKKIIAYLLYLFAIFIAIVWWPGWMNSSIITIAVLLAVILFVVFYSASYRLPVDISALKLTNVNIKNIAKSSININPLKLAYLSLPVGELYISEGEPVKHGNRGNCRCLWGIWKPENVINVEGNGYKCNWYDGESKKWCRAPAYKPLKAQSWQLIRGYCSHENEITFSSGTNTLRLRIEFV